VAGATGNIVYQDAVMRMRDEISTGMRMQRAMENTGLFPNMVVQMIAVGEESGSLDEMAAKVADFYEADVDNAVDSMSSLPEPLIMAILGVLVGGLVIAMDQDHARGIATLMRQRYGLVPTVALSDDPSASQRIEHFAEGSMPWLVAVRMVSEGVDVPRLAVGVYATTTATPLFFAQAVGRFVRARRRGETASVFVPSVPSLLGFAAGMEVERDHVRGRRVTAEADHFAALGVTHHQMIAIGIENIVINTRRTTRQIIAHFTGKNPVTQTLGFENIVLAAGETDGKTGTFGATRFGTGL